MLAYAIFLCFARYAEGFCIVKWPRMVLKMQVYNAFASAYFSLKGCEHGLYLGGYQGPSELTAIFAVVNIFF